MLLAVFLFRSAYESAVSSALVSQCSIRDQTASEREVKLKSFARIAGMT